MLEFSLLSKQGNLRFFEEILDVFEDANAIGRIGTKSERPETLENIAKLLDVDLLFFAVFSETSTGFRAVDEHRFQAADIKSQSGSIENLGHILENIAHGQFAVRRSELHKVGKGIDELVPADHVLFQKVFPPELSSKGVLDTAVDNNVV
jgi:hypothetical protein